MEITYYHSCRSSVVLILRHFPPFDGHLCTHIQFEHLWWYGNTCFERMKECNPRRILNIHGGHWTPGRPIKYPIPFMWLETSWISNRNFDMSASMILPEKKQRKTISAIICVWTLNIDDCYQCIKYLTVGGAEQHMITFNFRYYSSMRFWVLFRNEH